MSYSPPAGNAIDLNLSGSYAAPAGNDVVLDLGTQAGIGAISFTAAGSFASLSGAATFGYDNAVPRPLAASSGFAFRDAAGRRVDTAAPFEQTIRRPAEAASAWREASRRPIEIGSAWDRALPRADEKATPWGDARAIEAALSAPYIRGTPRNVERSLDFDQARAIASEMLAPFEILRPFNRADQDLGFRDALALSAILAGGFKRKALASNDERATPWGTALLLTSIGSPPYLPIEPPPPGLSITLDLKCPPLLEAGDAISLTLSAFECNGLPPPGPGGAINIPVRRVYFVSNSVSIVRLPGREPIKASDVQLSTDSASWAWGMRASIPLADLALVEPQAGEPTKIEISINGVAWVIAVESISSERQFGRSSASISGRSLSASLAAPYALPRSREEGTAKNAQQLALDELNLSGFTLNWSAVDWLVPGGAFSYSSLTPIDAIGKIVGAVGGYLQSARSAQEILALPGYPLPPWEWASATPDVSIPWDVVKSLGSQFERGSGVNAVFVSGERYGAAATVRRLGTIGDKFGGQFIDPLLTQNAALRERGIVEIAKAGQRGTVSLEMPILPEYGILTPGQLIQFTDAGAQSWRGLVRGVAAAAQRSEDALRVSQRVEIERHFA